MHDCCQDAGSHHQFTRQGGVRIFQCRARPRQESTAFRASGCLHPKLLRVGSRDLNLWRCRLTQCDPQRTAGLQGVFIDCSTVPVYEAWPLCRERHGMDGALSESNLMLLSVQRQQCLLLLADWSAGQRAIIKQSLQEQSLLGFVGPCEGLYRSQHCRTRTTTLGGDLQDLPKIGARPKGFYHTRQLRHEPWFLAALQEVLFQRELREAEHHFSLFVDNSSRQGRQLVACAEDIACICGLCKRTWRMRTAGPRGNELRSSSGASRDADCRGAVQQRRSC